MNKNAMVNEMVNFLSKYEYEDGLNYTPTTYGCGVIFDTEMRNKGNLISALKKHPNYNGNGQIVLDEKFHRERDNRTVRNFLRWLCDFEDNREYLVDFYHDEVVKVKAVIKNYPYNWVSQMDTWQGKEVVTISYDGSNQVWCRLNGDENNANTFWFEVDTLERLDGTPYCKKRDESEPFFSHSDFCVVRQIVNDEQYLTPEMTETANEHFSWLRAHNGQKASRIVKKICDHFGISKDAEWNSMFTKFADAINPLEVDTWTIISWNPIDYWGMSYGNSWTSCHSVDKTDLNGTYSGSYHGCYSGGTESYMLDPSSVVVYVIDRSYKGNRYELEPKIMRQMFHISEDGTSFVQGRLYPQDNDTGAKERYDKFRAIMQRVVSECFGHLNYWDVKKGTENCCNAIISQGVHYRDYEYFDNCTLSTLKEGYTGALIEVGENPICPCCGAIHYDEECVQCEDCRDVKRCYNCGDSITSDYNTVEAYDGELFCCPECAEAAGYVYCNDGEWHRDNGEVCYDYYLDEYVYDYYERFITTRDGHTYSTEENAVDDGYRCVDDEWYKEDEVVYNEESEEWEVA